DAIRYSGAISDRITSASSTPMTMIAIGMTCARSLLEIELMSYSAGASPVTPESTACSVPAAAVAASRAAGVAFMAAVVDGSPADSEVSNWIVLPTGLSGPVTPENTVSFDSCVVAASICEAVAGSQAGEDSLYTRLVGLAA